MRQYPDKLFETVLMSKLLYCIHVSISHSICQKIKVLPKILFLFLISLKSKILNLILFSSIDKQNLLISLNN